MKRFAATLAIAAAVFASCAPASAATWTEPNLAGLSGSLRKGSGNWLELPWTIVWQLGPIVPGSPLDPRAVQRLANGNTLVASRDSRGVYEVTPAGAIVWSYTTADDPNLTPFHAARLDNGNTLIVDRWQETVIEVDHAGTLVWRYGVPEDPATQGDDDAELPAPGELIDPFHAVRLPNGNTLIAENQACRVIEVRSADYAAGQPNDGYTADSIVWQYGATLELARDHGYATPYLDWPKYAVRLAGGNTLIADEAGSVVLEVTPAGAIAWSYGQRGVSGNAPGQLSEPTSAERLTDGTTLISDGKNNRVIRVNPAGQIVWEYSAASLLGLKDAGIAGPRNATVTPGGSILISDEGHDRLLELGRASSGLVTSAQLDCGLPGTRKQFASLAANVDAPAGTSYQVSYSVDGGTWKTLAGTALPAGTYGTLIRYRVSLSSTRRDVTPRLLGIAVAYQAAPTQPSNTSGTGSGSGTGTGTGTGAGDAGSKQDGGGSSGFTVTTSGEPLDGALSTQRGWYLASVVGNGTEGGDGSRGAGSESSGGAAPAPAQGGLLALAGLYALGALSLPLQRLLAFVLHVG